MVIFVFGIGALVWVLLLAVRRRRHPRAVQVQGTALAIAARELRTTVGLVEVEGVPGATPGFRTTVGEHPLVVFAFDRRVQSRRTATYVNHYVEILLEAPANRPYYVASRERGIFARPARATGLLYQPDVGDKRFTREVYIQSEETDAVQRAALAPPEVRAALRAVLDEFESVTVSPAGVMVTCLASAMHTQTLSFAKIAESLRVLADAHPDLVGTQGRPLQPRNNLSMLLWLPVAYVLALMLMSWCNHVPFAMGARLAGMLLTLPCYLLFLLVVYLFARGTYWGLDTFIFGAWIGFFSVPLIATPGAMALNAALDRSPALPVRAVVVSKENTGPNRRRVSYVLQLRPVSRAETWTRQVSWDVYNATQPGDTMTAMVHRGAFGWEWGDWQ